jgi:hypothetical protein
MRSSSKVLRSALTAAKQMLESLVKLEAQIGQTTELIANGGSAADAADFARSWPAALTATVGLTQR